MSILDDLNPPQRDAAASVDGPVLVLAGAGSGKTRVLTYRIAHLIEELGVPPWHVLAVTFTNKAAGEMRERVTRLVGERAGSVWIGTFHSICARLLRQDAAAFGLDPRFTIYDEDDRLALVRRVLELHGIGEQTLAPRAAVAQISRAKNAMLDPQGLARQAGASPARRQVAAVFATYQQELRRQNAFDFDDLLTEVAQQLGRHQEVLARYQERFRFLLVDEYQDTNRPQYVLCRQLAGARRNLFVVGDDDQSIYRFRGADIRNILDFQQDFPEAKVVRLEQNYRSTGRILAAANAVIRHNRSRMGKSLWTAAASGEPLVVVECDTDRVEAQYVVDRLRELVASGRYQPRDAAVLYRTNAQSRALEEELQRSGLPYAIVGGIRFYERKEVKDILAYLRLLANPADDTSFLRAIGAPRRGIGEVSLQRLRARADAAGVPLWAVVEQLEQADELRGAAGRGLGAFRELLRELQAARQTEALPRLGQLVYERSGYQQMLAAEGTPEAEARAQNIAQLVAFMTEFAQTREEATLESFLAEVALMAPVDEVRADANAVTLMTLHSAKGLEFAVVFMAGMEENLFPTSRAVQAGDDRPEEMEEERRLCYVGITRARERLHLTYARQRYAFGSLLSAEPSRFLAELPRELLRTEYRGEGSRTRSPSAGARATWSRRLSRPVTDPAQRAAAGPVQAAARGVHYEWDEAATRDRGPSTPAGGDAAGAPLAPGRWVVHPTFGRGQVLACTGRGADLKVTIQFGAQTKIVMARYAHLQPG